MSRKKRLKSGKIVNNFFRPLKPFHSDSLNSCIIHVGDRNFFRSPRALFRKIAGRFIIASLHKIIAMLLSIIEGDIRESRMNTAYFSTR
jgi:hypothetical protein